MTDQNWATPTAEASAEVKEMEARERNRWMRVFETERVKRDLQAGLGALASVIDTVESPEDCDENQIELFFKLTFVTLLALSTQVGEAGNRLFGEGYDDDD